MNTKEILTRIVNCQTRLHNAAATVAHLPDMEVDIPNTLASFETAVNDFCDVIDAEAELISQTHSFEEPDASPQ